eukprot:494409-Prorocentrum_minimum.AAC.3
MGLPWTKSHRSGLRGRVFCGSHRNSTDRVEIGTRPQQSAELAQQSAELARRVAELEDTLAQQSAELDEALTLGAEAADEADALRGRLAELEQEARQGTPLGGANGAVARRAAEAEVRRVRKGSAGVKESELSTRNCLERAGVNLLALCVNSIAAGVNSIAAG